VRGEATGGDATGHFSCERRLINIGFSTLSVGRSTRVGRHGIGRRRERCGREKERGHAMPSPRAMQQGVEEEEGRATFPAHCGPHHLTRAKSARHETLSSHARTSFLRRFGEPRGGEDVDRGEPVQGQPCWRTFSDCVERPCRLQSPGYPGLYPGNRTCRYLVHVRRSDVPRGMRPIIILSQVSGGRGHS